MMAPYLGHAAPAVPPPPLPDKVPMKLLLLDFLLPRVREAGGAAGV